MRCVCKTKNGTRCKRQATKNNKCAQHYKAGCLSPRSSPRKLSPSEREKQGKFCRCVMSVKKKQGTKVNPWAICTASVGRINNSCKEFE